MLLDRSLTDTELSVLINRSVESIQVKRSHLKKAVNHSV